MKAIKNENWNHRRIGLHMSEYMLTECYTEPIPEHNESEYRRPYRKRIVVERNTHTTHDIKYVSTGAFSLSPSASISSLSMVFLCKRTQILAHRLSAHTHTCTHCAREFECRTQKCKQLELNFSSLRESLCPSSRSCCWCTDLDESVFVYDYSTRPAADSLYTKIGAFRNISVWLCGIRSFFACNADCR